MLKYRGGHKVGKGTYWNLSDGSRVDVEDQDILPGGEALTYTRVRPGVMVLLSPLLGMLYVISLPFIAVASVVTLLGGKILDGILELASKVVYFEWRPTEAYLGGKKKRKREEKKDSSEKE